jgi:transposase
MFPYITNFSYNHLARWQVYTKTPSSTPLEPSGITRLTQSVTEHHRMSFLSLCAKRMDKDELYTVDFTSRSAYGSSLADIRWGHNMENNPLPQTNEVVVYSLSNHMPLYYRTFPGNIPDSRTMGVIQKDLHNAGFKSNIIISDRGYNSVQTLEQLILSGQRAIMCM